MAVVLWDGGPVRKFPSGRVVATPAALATINQSGEDPMVFLSRHLAGDWGDLSDTDKWANDAAIKDGNFILSKYKTAKGKDLYVITEADRSVTTFLLPGER